MPAATGGRKKYQYFVVRIALDQVPKAMQYLSVLRDLLDISKLGRTRG